MRNSNSWRGGYEKFEQLMAHRKGCLFGVLSTEQSETSCESVLPLGDLAKGDTKDSESDQAAEKASNPACVRVNPLQSAI